MMGRIASRKIPGFILHPMIRLYIWLYKIDMKDYDIEICKIKSFNEFFTRKLKSDARKFEGKLLSPSDSKITDYGKVNNNIKLAIKGMECSINELLYEKNDFVYSSFTVFYLSPADYHRFHAPFDMEIEKIAYVPGKLHSVKPKKLENYLDLYCLNRRVILFGTSQYGRFAMILVGALVVGRIVLSFHPLINRRKHQYYNVNYSIKKADELGYFELGSTIILLTESEALASLIPSIGDHVMVGEEIYGE
jgi:phosphatidylserine decarboxylase